VASLVRGRWAIQASTAVQSRGCAMSQCGGQLGPRRGSQLGPWLGEPRGASSQCGGAVSPLAVPQARPPFPSSQLEEEEARSLVDSDLTSAPLQLLAGEARSEVAITGGDSLSGHLDLWCLDVSAALDQVNDSSHYH